MSLRFDQLNKEGFEFCRYMMAEQGELDFGLPAPKQPYPENGIGFSCFDKHAQFIRSHNHMRDFMEWEIKECNQAAQIEGLFQAFFALNRQGALAHTHKTALLETLVTLSHAILGEVRCDDLFTTSIN